MKINFDLNPDHFSEILENFWKLSGDKIKLIDREYDPANGSPVFTVEGKYSTRGWTEWTQGFQHAKATADYSVYYGKGRDAYDVRGRTAHESIFNTNDGSHCIDGSYREEKTPESGNFNLLYGPGHLFVIPGRSGS